jgi:alkylation response protein AidB-like acyl-CoA dehydrogenase
MSGLERRLPLRLTTDEEELRTVVRDFVTTVLPSPTADEGSWPALDPEGRLWRRLCTELGLQGMAVPDEFGGQGFGVSALAIAFHELGRSVSPVPLLGSVALAGRLLVQLPPGPDRDRLLAGLAEGELRATVMYDGTFTASDGRLSGRATAVIDGPVADVLLIVAAEDVYAVEASDQSVEVRAMDGIDMTRQLADVRLHSAPATLLATGAPDAIVRARSEATVLLAAELTGVAEAALSEAVEYAKIRTQFGRQIGSFQALKHRMADMLVAIEGAWSTSRYAALLCDASELAPSTVEIALAAGTAKAAAASAASFATAENIQIHGGIGFTWEHPAHLRFRRARSAAVLLGSANEHRKNVAQVLSAGGRRGSA